MTKPFSTLLVISLLTVATAATAEGPPPPATPPAAAPPAAPPAPPARHVDPVTGTELIHVKGGCFQMGDLYDDGVSGDGQAVDEQPVHEVCLGDYYIGKYELTNAAWRTIMGSVPPTDSTCPEDDCPVGNISWDDVVEFLRRLNAKGGAGKYRLPTEAEWEYAARSGGKAERYAGSNDVESLSWYASTTGYAIDGTISPISRAVGRRVPNGLGLYDMSGNVYEFTADWYGADYYATSPRDNPTGPATGTEHVKRGGCGHGHPGNGRTARRARGDGPDGLLGLRLAWSP